MGSKDNRKEAVRKIDTIIIHCSSTPSGRKVTVNDIRSWHKARGWSDIGYHFVIYEDGTVHLGRKIDKVGAHAKGYNTSSVGICYIGGMDAAGKPKDTLNNLQRDAIQALILELKSSHPITKLIGHNEVSSKECPCFRVSDKFTL